MSSPSFHDSSTERDLAEVAWVRRLAVAMVRDERAADDIAQEALIASLRHPPAATDQPTGWFVRVLRNLMRFRARTDARRAAHELLGAEPEHPEDPSRSVERLELQEELLRAVRALPDPYRETVLQRWVEDLEPAEIARRAGIPVSTVHTRSSRALNLLREHLDRRSGGDRSSWIRALVPMLAKSSTSPIPLLALNLKLKLVVAAVLVLGLLTTLRLALQPHEPAPVLVPEREVASLEKGQAQADLSAGVAAAPTRAPEVDAAPQTLIADEPNSVRVQVRDDQGPVSRYAIRVVPPERSDRLQGLEELAQEHADGEAKLKLDRSAFSVQVLAELHAPLVLGPFERSPGTLAAVLQRRPGVRGHVMRAGRAAEGALVSLHESVESGRRAWRDGLLIRSRDELVKGKSADDGAFALTLLKSGRYWVRARLDDWADAELGPFDLDPNIGKDGLVLELTRGGSIEGQVFLPPGETFAASPIYTLALDQSGVLMHRLSLAPFEVIATRGDALARRAQPNAEGRFRFEGLTPGSWFVVRAPGVRQTEGDDGPGYAPELSNCEVLEGVVTRHDLDLRSGPETVLAVNAQIGSTPCAGWKLRVASFVWRGARLDGFHDLGPDGRLELPTVPGPAVLHLVGSLGSRSTIDMREQVVLKLGLMTWSIYKTAGALEGRLAETSKLKMGSAIELRLSEGAQDFLCTIHVGENRRFPLDVIPAGNWVATNPGDPAAPGIAFTVSAGRTTQLELPW